MVADKVLIDSCRLSQVHEHRALAPDRQKTTPSGYVSSDVGTRQKASTKCRRLRHLSNRVSIRSTGTGARLQPQSCKSAINQYFGMEPVRHSFGNAVAFWATYAV